ncbi:MAG: hypothetical protein JXR49_06315 [Acidobacteria bacterium]|nr:hypothetical protein [Acidobacteriota bacterium]
MYKNTQITTLLLVVLFSVTCLWAVDKPTERTEDCTTSECHNSYRRQSHVHKPVSLGVCKFCHKSVDPKEHTFELFRTGRELCGSCHQEQTVGLTTIPSMAQLRPKAQVGEGKYLHEPFPEAASADRF